MTKSIDKFRMFIVAAVLFAGWQYVAHEHREAVRTKDYSRCWTQNCKTDILDTLVR